MDSTLIMLLVFLVILAPLVMSIVALVRVVRLDRSIGQASEPDLDVRVAALERRLRTLEGQLGALEAKASAAVDTAIRSSQPLSPFLSARPVESRPPAPPESPMPAAAPERAPSAPIGERALLSHSVPAWSSQSSGRASGLDWETTFAGKWLNYVGIISLLFAAAFFIKYAFDNNWIGPRGRVGIGLAAGALLVLWSDRLLRRGYGYFSEGIAGLGTTVLYLSLWAGWHYYRVFDSGVAFAGMIVVTAALTVIAVGRDSERLALVALAGGFLTPSLVSTGHDHQIVLFSYTALLSTGMLALERARRWVWLPPLAFFATEVYYWGWYSDFYRPEKLLRTAAFATLFFVLFAALPTLRGRREGRLADSESLVFVANGLLYLAALRVLLWPSHRWALTLAFLALGAAHLLVLRALPAPRAGETSAARWLFAALALAYVSLAVPARLDHQWLTIAWAVEGMTIVWSGWRTGSRLLRGTGLLLLAIAAGRLAALPIPAQRFLWNERFAAFAVAVACFALSATFLRHLGAQLQEADRIAIGALAIAVNVFSLLALSLEIWDLFGRVQASQPQHWPAQQMALSILWTLYAAGLIVLGMARKSAFLRWQALALFAVVVGKVFLYDLSSLERFYRILSFFVLGSLLLGVSFLYQQRTMARKSRQESRTQ